MKGHFTKTERILHLSNSQGVPYHVLEWQGARRTWKQWAACLVSHGHFRFLLRDARHIQWGLGLKLVGANWSQSCGRYHRHVPKHYPINCCLSQIRDSWQWKSKSGYIKRSSHVPRFMICIQKDVCVWIWPLSAHTQTCACINTSWMCIFYPFSGSKQGVVCKGAHRCCVLRQLPLSNSTGTSTESRMSLSLHNKTT